MKGSLLAVLLLWPAGAAAQSVVPRPNHEPDRGRPVPIGQPQTAAPMPVEVASTDNGMTLIVNEYRRLPLVCVRIALPLGGSVFDPDGKQGLAALVARMLREGTATRTDDEFSDALDDVGAKLTISATADALVVQVFAHKDDIEKAVALAADALRHPALPAQRLAPQKRWELLDLQRDLDMPEARAGSRLAQRVLEGSPYARRETPETVGAVTIDDVRRYVSQRVRPEGAIVAASGDLSMPDLQGMIGRAFGGWAVAEAAPAPVALPKAVAAGRSPGLVIDVIDAPGSAQSVVKVGQLTVPPGSPDVYAVSAATVLLGAGFNSRLNQILREQKHWTYGVDTAADDFVAADRALAINTSVQTDATAPAVVEILRQMRRLQDEPVADEELGAAKREYLGMRETAYQTVQVRAERLAESQLYRGSTDYETTYRERFLAVSPAEVQAAARKYFVPDAVQIVIVGDAAKIADDLAKLGVVRVFDSAGRPKALGQG